MSFDETRLRALQDAELASRTRFFLMGGTVRDADVLRHARDLWMESKAAIIVYRRRRTPANAAPTH